MLKYADSHMQVFKMDGVPKRRHVNPHFFFISQPLSICFYNYHDCNNSSEIIIMRGNMFFVVKNMLTSVH
jgi:hypothetical protein